MSFPSCSQSQRQTQVNTDTYTYSQTHLCSPRSYTAAYTYKWRWINRVEINLFYSWMSVRMCCEYWLQLGLHWQAAKQTVEQLFICPNVKYFVAYPNCPTDFLWKGTRITVAHHIKPPETRWFGFGLFVPLRRHNSVLQQRHLRSKRLNEGCSWTYWILWPDFFLIIEFFSPFLTFMKSSLLT